MSAQRANDISEDDRRAGDEAVAALRPLHDELRQANPEFTDDDWDRLADELAEEVNEGLRDIVRRSRGELPAQSS